MCPNWAHPRRLTISHSAVILGIERALPADGQSPHMITEVTAGLGS